MGRYTVIPQDAFNALQMDAGVLLNNFDISSATSGNAGFTDENVICATTGGIQASCVPTYSDFAEDVDNAPINLKEFKHLDGWDCKVSTNSLGTSPELIKLSLGAADIEGNTYVQTTDTSIVSGKTYYTRSGTSPNYTYTPVESPSAASLSTYYELVPGNKVVPRRNLEQTDFTDIWWVGDRADGGLVAIKIMDALSTGGFSIQTNKNAKGQITLEITGHVSINTQDVVPMEFYSIDPAA